MSVVPLNSAVRILRGIDTDLGRTRERLASGMRVASAKDDPFAWQAATALRSDVRSRSTIQEMIEAGRSAVSAGSAALAVTRATLGDLRALLVQAKDKGANLSAVQSRLALVKAQLRATAATAVGSGLNLLTADTGAACEHACNCVPLGGVFRIEC